MPEPGDVVDGRGLQRAYCCGAESQVLEGIDGCEVEARHMRHDGEGLRQDFEQVQLERHCWKPVVPVVKRAMAVLSVSRLAKTCWVVKQARRHSICDKDTVSM